MNSLRSNAVDELLMSMIERHEGRRNKPYRCPAGRLTIGVGHNMEARPLPRDMQAFLDKHGYITDGMVDQLLITDLGDAMRDAIEVVGAQVWDTLTLARQYAIIDMTFTLGAGGLRKFRRFLAAVRAGEWTRAADEIRASRYYRQLGGDPAGTDDCRLERPEEIVRMIETGRLVEAKAA